MTSLSSIKENFLNTFQLLSPKQQKIWRYIQGYAKRYRHVFPSHTTIATDVNCCRDTVIQAIKKFCQLGWLGSIKRCFRSNLYFVADDLKNIDTTNPSSFKVDPESSKPTENPTQKPTENPTLYKTVYNGVSERNTYQKPKTVQHPQCKETSHMLESIGILGKDLWCLARYGLRAVSLAIEDYKTRKAPGSIRNLSAWLTNRCQAHAVR